MNRFHIILILSLFITGSVYSQDYINTNYDILGFQDLGIRIIKKDSSYLILGASIDSTFYRKISLLEIDKNGLIIQKKSFGRIDHYFYPQAIIQVNDNYYIGGYYNTNGFSNSFILKLKLNLDSLNSFSFSNPSGAIGIKAMSLSNEKDIIVTGHRDTTGSFINRDLFLAKIDTLGNPLWWNYYGTISDDLVESIAISQDNYYYLGGYKRVAGKKRQFVIKTDTAGNEIWNKTFGNSAGDNYAAYVTATADSGIVFCSQFYSHHTSTVSNYSYGYIVKIDKFGNVEWQKKYNGAKYWQGLYKIIENVDGSFTAIGTTPLPTNGGQTGGWILKIASNGDSLWSRAYTPFIDNDPLYALYDVVAGDDGGFYAAGFVTNRRPECNTSSTNSQDFWVMKTDSLGCLFSGCDTICGNFKPDFDYVIDTGYTVTFTYSGSTAIYWRWYFGHNDVYPHPLHAFCETQPQVTATYPGPGTYQVLLRTQDPCGDYDTLSKWITLYPVGISEKVPKQDLLKLYPNPANEQLTVKIRDQQLPSGLKLEVFDITGRRTRSMSVEEAKTNIDISDLKPGVYFLVLRDDKGALERKSFVVGR